LFYVALTRAEKRAFLSYTLSRYRWGKLIDAEPSRFIEEIDSKYLEMHIPKDNYSFKPLMNTDIFGDAPATFKKPIQKPIKEKLITQPSQQQLQKLRKLTPVQQQVSDTPDLPLEVGTKVSHDRFGYGVVQSIEGKGSDKKAAIEFSGVGVKKLLLRFAKLTLR